jgi:NADP-dependent 3-hydroxy acid dehydrogenase YdfG/acyl carrier protein
VGLLFFDSEIGQLTHLLMAAVTLSVIPMIVLFVLLQKTTESTIKELEQVNFQALSNLEPYRHYSLRQWLYEVSWQPESKPEAPTTLTEAPGLWILLVEPSDFSEQFAAQLQNQGYACALVQPGPDYRRLQQHVWQINPEKQEDFQHLFQEVKSFCSSPLQGILHCWSLSSTLIASMNSSELEQAQILGCASTLPLIQALRDSLGRDQRIFPKLWLVTRGAVPVANEIASPRGLAQSPLWGMGRVIALEHPELWGGMLDLSPEPGEAEVKTVLREVMSGAGEDQVAYRGEQRYVARLVRTQLPEWQEKQVDPDGTYLITGGLGVLGIRTAEWLVERGAQHLVLLSQRAREQSQAAISRLQNQGIRILVACGDVSNQVQMEALINQIQADMPPLRGLIHAAGVMGELQDLESMSVETLSAVMRPKLIGGWILHQLTQDLELDFFVSFSSIASVWGSRGQGHYAAANHFLDALAAHRHAQGLVAQSINWGPWAGGGMATEEIKEWVGRSGVGILEPKLGMQALSYILGDGRVQTVVADVDWTIFKPAYEAGRKSSFLAVEVDLGDHKTSPDNLHLGERNELLASLHKADISERKELLIAYLQEAIAKVLGFPFSQTVDPLLGFFDLGIDSLLAVELRNILQHDLEIPLSSTLLFKYSTILDLAEYFLSKLDQVDSRRDDLELHINKSNRSEPNLDSEESELQRELRVLQDLLRSDE